MDDADAVQEPDFDLNIALRIAAVVLVFSAPIRNPNRGGNFDVSKERQGRY